MENNKKLKIVFVGIPDMAIICLNNLLEQGFDIVAVVPPDKKHDTYDFFKKFVLSKNLNLLEFEKSPDETIDSIKSLNADIGVVCSYNEKLSCDFLNSTKFGYINCHPSLLPEYRGASPYFHIVKNGEKVSGITLHFMDNNFDTGDIIYQEKFNLILNETMGTIFNRTTYMISDALVKVLNKLQNEGELKSTPQDKNCFKEAIKVDGNFNINFQKDVYKLECLIRACNPFYNANTIFRQTNLKIIDAKAIEIKHNFPLGMIVKSNENEILVSALNGFLSLKILSIGTWGIFNNKDFYYIFSPKIGEFLGKTSKGDDNG